MLYSFYFSVLFTALALLLLLLLLLLLGKELVFEGRLDADSLGRIQHQALRQEIGKEENLGSRVLWTFRTQQLGLKGCLQHMVVVAAACQRNLLVDGLPQDRIDAFLFKHKIGLNLGKVCLQWMFLGLQ